MNMFVWADVDSKTLTYQSSQFVIPDLSDPYTHDTGTWKVTVSYNNAGATATFEVWETDDPWDLITIETDKDVYTLSRMNPREAVKVTGYLDPSVPVPDDGLVWIRVYGPDGGKCTSDRVSPSTASGTNGDYAFSLDIELDGKCISGLPVKGGTWTVTATYPDSVANNKGVVPAHAEKTFEVVELMEVCLLSSSNSNNSICDTEPGVHGG